MLAPALHGAFPRPKQEKLHQRIFPTQGSNPGLLHRRRMVFFFFFFLPLAPPGKPRYWIYKRAIASAPDALGVESTLKAIGLRGHGRVMAHIWSCDASVTDSVFHVFVGRRHSTCTQRVL